MMVIDKTPVIKQLAEGNNINNQQLASDDQTNRQANQQFITPALQQFLLCRAVNNI